MLQMAMKQKIWQMNVMRHLYGFVFGVIVIIHLRCFQQLNESMLVKEDPGGLESPKNSPNNQRMYM